MGNIIKNWIDNNLLVYLDKLLKRPNIINGLIEKKLKKIKKDGDYVHGVLGAVNQNQEKEDGNFDEFIPVGEQQNKPFEKMWCVSENGICNQIETDFNFFISLVNDGKANRTTKELVKIFRYFGLIIDNRCLLDTAYVASGAGTTRRGISYDKPANFVRKNGLIPKGTYYPYRTWNELYFPNTGVWINGNKVPQSFLDAGRKVAEYVDITYKWVKPSDMDKVLKDGTQGTSCYAWGRAISDIYQPVGYSANHAILKFRKSEPKWKKIFDSYPPFVKKLALNYRLGYGMQLSFGIKKELPNERQILLDNGYEWVIRAEKEKGGRGEAYEINTDKLEYLPPKELIKNSVKEKAVQGKIKFITEKEYNNIKV